MRKLIICLLLNMLAIFLFPTSATTEPVILINVNGKTHWVDPPPMMYRERVFVPIRFVAETLGADVTWNNEAYQVLITTSTKPMSEAEYLYWLKNKFEFLRPNTLPTYSDLGSLWEYAFQSELRVLDFINEALSIQPPPKMYIFHKLLMEYLFEVKLHWQLYQKCTRSALEGDSAKANMILTFTTQVYENILKNTYLKLEGELRSLLAQSIR